MIRSAVAEPASPPSESEFAEQMEAVVGGRLAKALFLTLAILVVELAGGVLSYSLALLSDAGHVTTDICALGLAWLAVRQSQRPADDQRSFGYHRAGILAAMVNGSTLIVLVFVITWEAAQRLLHPVPVQGAIVIVSALVGVGVNAYIALSFREGGANLNIRAALLHAVGDLLASIGVIVAGLIILLTGWLYADPLVSVLIAALIGWNALRIVRETVNILLEGTPRNLELGAVRREVEAIEGVVTMHDLHVWSISSEHTALAAHLVVADQSLADSEHLMRRVEDRLCERFGIEHTTIQVEFCHPCTADAVHLATHNHPHMKLARLATTARRRTPLSRRVRVPE